MRKAIDQWGFKRAAWAGLMRRLGPWVLLYQVQIRANEPTDQANAKADIQADIPVRLANHEDLQRAVVDLPDWLKADFVESALARGDICAAAFDGPRMIALQWASFTVAQLNEQLNVGFAAPFRYGYKGFAHPDYRGRRIAQRVMRYLDGECLARGYTHTIVYVETHNYASLANLRRLGNQCIGYAGYVRLMGRCIPFRTPGTKRHGFYFYRAVETETARP